MSMNNGLRWRQPMGIFPLCLAFIVIFWAALVLDSYQIKSAAIARAQDAARNLAFTFQEGVKRTIDGIDQVMMAIISENNETGESYHIPAWAENSPLLDGIAFQMAMIGPDGIEVASSIGPMKGIDLSDRVLFQYHLDPSASQPYISVPLIGRASGRLSIQITRRMTRKDGSFGGVLVVSIDPFYFSRLFDHIALGRNSVVNLVGDDGVVRGHRSVKGYEIGQNVHKPGQPGRMRSSGTGAFITRSNLDGIERIYTSAPVLGYPLYMVVGLAADDVLAEVRDQLRSHLAVGGLLTVLIGLLGWYLAREIKSRHQRDMDALGDKITRENKAVLDNALNNIHHGLLVYDKDDRIVAINRSFIDMYRLSPETAKPGCTLRDLLEQRRVSGTLAGDVDAYIAKIDVNMMDKIIAIPDGRSIRVAHRILDEGGRVSTHDDVTERKRARERILGLNAELEERVAERTAELVKTQDEVLATRIHAEKMESLGKLTGGIAHDFNNYLAIIIGNLDLVRRLPADDPMAKELTEEALSGALRGAELTKSLLAFSRRQPLTPQRTDIGDALTADAILLNRLGGQEVTLTTEFAPGLWPTCIDRGQFDSCIINLGKNACAAMPGGGVLMISARNAQLDEQCAAVNSGVVPGDYVLIEISDTGNGMDPETLKRVFEPFFSTKPVGHGTGLGLSMVFGFVGQSNGHINVRSEVGNGTTVQIYLPRDSEAESVATAPLLESAVEEGLFVEVILVVEDNEQMRRTAVTQLTLCGYRVIEAEHGAAALAILEERERHIDLLFTDIMMPGNLDGYALAELALERRPCIRILLTSGFSGDKVGHNRDRAEPLNLLRKPYRFDDLARAVREALAQPQQKAA
jgi:signal transduction histidine kinase/ActR/RegA family two-component response regulator